MPWHVILGEKRVNCDDLPMEVYAAIEKEHGVKWHELLAQPMAYSAAGPALIRAAASHVGVTPPTPITPRVLVDSFTIGDEDRPIQYDDGLPNSEGAPTTD